MPFTPYKAFNFKLDTISSDNTDFSQTDSEMKKSNIPNKKLNSSSSLNGSSLNGGNVAMDSVMSSRFNMNRNNSSSSFNSSNLNNGNGNSTGSNNGLNTKNQTRNKNSSNYSKRNNGNRKKPDIDIYEYDNLEASLLRTKGKKGVDISHLLNFTLPEHDQQHDYDSPNSSNNRSSKYRNKKKNQLSYGMNLSGRSYINVNYKFIVDYRLDYKIQSLDPNVPLDDSSILRVIIPKNDTQCSICLSDDLVAPRMTRCGHVFCYPCIIRLFQSANDDDEEQKKKLANTDYNYSKKKSIKCPLCSEFIKENHTLLPVLISQIDERFEKPVVGEESILQLMFRPRSKSLALPYHLFLSSPNSVYEGNIPWIDEDSTTEDFLSRNGYAQFARIMKSNWNFLNRCFEKEINDLKNLKLLDQLNYNDIGLHYDEAIRKIELSRDTLKTSFDESSDGFQEQNSNGQIDDLIESLDSIDINKLSSLQHDKQNINVEENGFYFYQTSFNSRIKFFLSSLDIQILKNLYGDYQLFPVVLKMKIENINYENSIVTEELIHKLKYLGHLPLGTEVGFLELDWFEQNTNSNGRNNNNNKKRSILPDEIYQMFKKQLLDRHQRMMSKKIREEKNRIRSEEELELKTLEFYSNENKMKLEDYGYTPHSNLKLVNEFDSTFGSRPSFGEEDAPALSETYSPPFNSTDAHSDTAVSDGENDINNFNNTTNNSGNEYQKTVWGTTILKSQNNFEEDEFDDGIDAEFIIQQAKSQQATNKKGKKKKIILRLV
ncbi:hypothetical protein B5S31_g112 [[Candida] boidinii]|nr:hypothetical protein B5S31_g112 [[Candida] boidinii]